MDRYDRQIRLKEWGIDAQKRFSKAKALVVGAGGLGCPVLNDLAASGIGGLGLVEGDRVAESNLQRQFLYSEKEVGRLKADAAKERLQEINSELKIELWSTYLDADLAVEIFPNYDLIIDCTDNFPSRYLIDDVCRHLGKVWVSGSLDRFQYQLATYGWNGKHYFRNFIPEVAEQWLLPDCSTAGVLGPVVSAAGHQMALEAMFILGLNRSGLAASLELTDTWNRSFDRFKLEEFALPPIDEKWIRSKDYQINLACSTDVSGDLSLKEWEDLTGSKTRLNVGSDDYIDAKDLKKDLTDLSDWEPIDESNSVLIYCEKGETSRRAMAYLRMKFPNTKWYNLKGGTDGIKEK